MSKPGEPFEGQIALILRSAGFVIKEQPHKVMYQGKMMGDLDVTLFCRLLQLII